MGQGVQGFLDIGHGEDIHDGLHVEVAIIHTEAELTSLFLGYHNWGGLWSGAQLDGFIS